jgi:quercetin dioxygenase-like cupin family protein
MQAFHYLEIPAEPAEGREGVAIRWVLGATRIIEVQSGCSTAYHAHDWEHEVVVLEGQGRVTHGGGETRIGPGSCIFVAPSEEHQFANVGQAVLRFVCVIPMPKQG